MNSGFINYATFGRSDHFPIFNTVTLNEPFHNPANKAKRIKLKPVRRTELNRKDMKAIANMNEGLVKQFLSINLDELDVTKTGLLLEKIARFTVQQVRCTMPKTPSRNKKMHDGWSPTYSVYFHQQHAFQEILRHLNGQHGRQRWRTEEQRKQGIRVYLKHWSDDTLNNYDFTSNAKTKLLQCTGTSLDSWTKANDLVHINIPIVFRELN